MRVSRNELQLSGDIEFGPKRVSEQGEASSALPLGRAQSSIAAQTRSILSQFLIDNLVGNVERRCEDAVLVLKRVLANRIRRDRQ
jgi:hypothetical protein